MIELIVGILLGIILLPVFICLYPSKSTFKKKTDTFNLKTSNKEIPLEQAKIVLRSLHTCTDLFWANVLINRFWCELSDSSAQAYRLKNHIKKILDDIPGTGIIRSIEVLGVNIGIQGPTLKGIRIVGEDELDDLFQVTVKKARQTKKSHIAYKSKDGSLDTEKVYSKIFKNVHTVISVLFQGSIKIKLKIGFPKDISLHTDVFINKIEGDILTRFPSINYNTRLEYTFLRTPEMEIGIEAGVSKGKGEEYFKQTISNFISRTIKFTILKSFVYPSFNTLYLPLIVPSFKNFDYKISVLNTLEIDNCANLIEIDKIKESMCLFIAMDYKILETANDIIFRNNNFLLNDKEKIFCTHFPIPECALNSSHFISSRNFIYGKLTIKESKIMNQIYDLSILKDVISSFREITTLHNYNSVSSLIEVVFADRKMEFIRIVTDDSIFFQKNDAENPEFLIFSIRNKELFIYEFTFSPILKMTKNRIYKIKMKLEMKIPRKISMNKIFKYSKNALTFWKVAGPKLAVKPVEDVKNIVDSDYKNVIDQIRLIQQDFTGNPTFSHKFNCPLRIIKDILMQDAVRIKFISDQTRIFRFINENKNFKSVAVENKDSDLKDFILHTFDKGNLIFDIIDNKKIVYEIKEIVRDDVSTKFIDMIPIADNITDPVSLADNITKIYKGTSISETELDKKKTKITFLDEKSKLNNVNSKSNLNTVNSKSNLNTVNSKSNTNNVNSKLEVDTVNEIDNFTQTRFRKADDKYETILNIYVDEGISLSKENPLYESIYTRIIQQEIKYYVQNSSFEKLELKKEFRKDFFGDLGGIYIEFKTEISEDFKLSLYSTALKKNILEIQKVITSKPVKLIIPIFEEDILLLKLVPKFLKNRSIEIKVVNLPKQFHRESLIDCNIGLLKNGTFTFPVVGSPKYIIFWEKEKEDRIKGFIESPYTRVPIVGHGTMRTDQMSYSLLYKNKGPKCREIEVYMGVTKK